MLSESRFLYLIFLSAVASQWCGHRIPILSLFESFETAFVHVFPPIDDSLKGSSASIIVFSISAE